MSNSVASYTSIHDHPQTKWDSTTQVTITQASRHDTILSQAWVVKSDEWPIRHGAKIRLHRHAQVNVPSSE